jgi:shikimate dehydrogenase
MLIAGPCRAAVLGSPISHSLSPVLHRAAYRALGLDWLYTAEEVAADGLADFVAGLDETWIGLSLTMPLKETVLRLLDGTSDTVRLTRSANTVVFGAGGRQGHNTDVFGIVAAIGELEVGDFTTACVLGSGATARSAAAAAARLGVRELTVVARRPEVAAEVAAVAGVESEVLGWAAGGRALAADVVFATVPGDAAAVFAASLPARPGVLLDVTYRPWPTTLAAAWLAAGGAVVGGASMLLWQAARQVELMTGHPAPVAAMRSALVAAG